MSSNLTFLSTFRGVNAIVYMVDAADMEKIEASRNELHNLLEKPQLAGIPVLVLGNKRDLPDALDENGKNLTKSDSMIHKFRCFAMSFQFHFRSD